MKKIFSLFIVVVTVGALLLLWQMYTRPTHDASHEEATATTTDMIAQNDPQVTCHFVGAYEVVVRTRTSEVGSDILIKHVTPSEEHICAYVKESGDVELPDMGPLYYRSLVGKNLVLDIGTAPYPRILSIVDVETAREVYRDSYNAPLDISDTSIRYWEPQTVVPTVGTCPDLSAYQKNGLGAGIEEYVSLSLTTYATSSVGESRCTARQ